MIQLYGSIQHRLIRQCLSILLPEIKEITYEELKALLGKGQNLLLVDISTKEEVAMGCIQGSINIPFATLGDALKMAPEEFKAKYGVTKPPLDTTELVFYGQLGLLGAAATDMAYRHGYVNARNYAGAYKEWSEKEGK